MSRLLLAAMLSTPAFAETSAERGPATPGTINYVEGQVSIGSDSISANDAGSAVLEANQTLTTQDGKAEILLTPGVFARVGDNSAFEMVSSGLTNTQVSVEEGEAIIEVAEIHPENNLLVDENGATIQLQKTGLYEFDADQAQFRVFEGQAIVRAEDERLEVKGGREIALNAPRLKVQKFDKKSLETEDDLYRWSSLRSAYVAEANVDEAPDYVGNWGGWYGGGWIGSGWYWDPWFSCYTFIPGNGIFYSPFGWGFYSPGWEYRAPIYLGGHYYHHFGTDAYPWESGMHYTPGLRGGGYGNGFRASYGFRGGVGGGRGLRSGGSHSGGGFHGGGYSGGGHGGGGHGR